MLRYHPETGTILICDFRGMEAPEMVKRRPVIVVSPRLRRRSGLCTVVPMSTTPPEPPRAWHYRLRLDRPLPRPYDATHHWVKADMVYTVSFSRLRLPFKRKSNGAREYDVRVLDDADMRRVRECMLHALGLTSLTDYL